MADKASQEPRTDPEDAQTNRSSRVQGGWITFPFITGSFMGLSLATSGVVSNLIVYLVKQFNIKSIDAAQISNVVNGCYSIAPVLGAIISDSYFGCFSVLAVTTALCFLSMVLFTLTATLPWLRPTPCPTGSDTCQGPSIPQLAVLFAALALFCISGGGNTATMGANQFDSASVRDVFFNWLFVVMYGSYVVGATAVVYVEDNLSWGWGFGVCTVASAVSLVVLLLGTRHYRCPTPAGSPFTGLARVVVAAMRKCRVAASEEDVSYYRGPGAPLLQPHRPTATFSNVMVGIKCLNHAAVEMEGDTNMDGSIAKPWRLCTVEQVEDLKAIIRILPVWSTSIFLSVSIGIQMSLTVLQALTVDRSLGPHFSVPAGSLLVASLAATAVSLSLLDRCVFPMWRRLRGGRDSTPLQRVGVGHVLNVAAMAASALVELRRMSAVRSHHLEDLPGAVVPMSVLWLLLPLVVVGVAAAMHHPGQVALYYREFPVALRNSATGMMSLNVALGFYLSAAVVDLVRKVTNWLPDNLNASKLDRVYWMVAVGCVLNFVFYVMLARVYQYRSVEEKMADQEGLPVPGVPIPECSSTGV